MGKLKWDHDSCIQESKKYISRRDFHIHSSGAYKSAYKNGWLDEMTWLKSKVLFGNNSQKIDNIYVYEFIQFNSVYVGRTIRPHFRDIEHRHLKHITTKGVKIVKPGTVYKFAKNNNVDIPPMKIVETNITIIDGQRLESEWIEKYRNNGWNILNKVKCGENSGSIGGIISKWNNKIKVFEESKRYTSRGEFKNKNSSAYQIALRNGWLDEMIWLIPQQHKPYTKDEIFEIAKTCSSKSEFKNKNHTAYTNARINGWLDEMTWLKPKLKWTKEKIIEVSKKFNKISDFKNTYSQACKIARRDGYLYELFPKVNK